MEKEIKGTDIGLGRERENRRQNTPQPNRDRPSSEKQFFLLFLPTIHPLQNIIKRASPDLALRRRREPTAAAAVARLSRLLLLLLPPRSSTQKLPMSLIV